MEQEALPRCRLPAPLEAALHPHTREGPGICQNSDSHLFSRLLPFLEQGQGPWTRHASFPNLVTHCVAGH